MAGRERREIMEPKKEKVNGKRLGITLTIMLLTALAVGGTMWYLMDQNAKSERTANEQQVAELQKQKDTLKQEAEDKVTANKEVVETTSTYSDKTGKYSVNIPSGYIVSTTGGCEGLCASSATLNKRVSDAQYDALRFTITATDQKKPISLSTWNKETEYTKTPAEENGTIKIGGITATKYSNPGFFGTDRDYRFIKGNITYYIQVDESIDKAVETAILSSFKFTK